LASFRTKRTLATRSPFTSIQTTTIGCGLQTPQDVRGTGSWRFTLWIVPARLAAFTKNCSASDDFLVGLRAMVPNPADVRGVNLDLQNRCEHYHGPADIVAIKMKCCGVYYACNDCHIALADHAAEVWAETEWDETAILCGACKTQLTIREYMRSSSSCPACCAPFNPRCRNHYHLYFDAPPSTMSRNE
jgi:uncharacterized CHY-type Zn-finger protein